MSASRRLSVNLTPDPAAALDFAVGLTGDSITAAVHAALKLYALYLQETRSKSGKRLAFVRRDGTFEVVAVL